MSTAKLIERLMHLLLVLFGVSVVVFLMLSVTPGDPVDIMIGDQQVTPVQRDELRREMGLDRPLIARYERFVGHALQGDLGTSYYYRRPVLSVIAERVPPTIELTLAALILALALAIPLGVLAAVKRDSLLDRLATLGSLLGVSMPGFWFGLLLILLFGVSLHWLPVTGQSSFSAEVPVITHFLLVDTLLAGNLRAFVDALAHLALPAITLALPMATVVMRVTRSSMLEVLQQDYVSFARTKGISPRRVIFRHALKNALIPTITVTALEVGSLLGGSMIIETIFGWPGLGRLVVESIFTRDYPLIQASVLLYAVTYVMVNFAADLLYTKINPRVTL